MSRILSKQFRDSLYKKFYVHILLWVDFFSWICANTWILEHLNTLLLCILQKEVSSLNYVLCGGEKKKKSFICLFRCLSFVSLNLPFTRIFWEKHLLVTPYLPFLCHSVCYIWPISYPSSMWVPAYAHFRLQFYRGFFCAFIVTF